MAKKHKGRTIPQGYLRCLSFQSLWDTRRSAATHQWCCSQHQEDREEKDRPSQWPDEETALIASSLDAPPPSASPQWTLSLKRGPMSRTQLMQFFAGIASATLHRRPGNLQGSSCTHCRGTPCSTLLMCGSRPREKQGMPHCPPRSRSCSESPAHCLHRHNSGQLWLPLPEQTPQPSTSWRTPKLQSRELQTPHRTADVPSPNQQHVSRSSAAFRSAKWNKTETKALPKWKPISRYGSGGTTELTKTSSRDQATVTLIWLAVNTKRSHSFSTSS